MKKISFKIKKEKFWIFIEKNILDSIFSFVEPEENFKEKGGYLFADKIKDTNEFRCKKITFPQKRDFSSEDFFEMSWKHKRIAKKINKKNPFLYQIGFYHTHKKDFGCEPSTYDLDVFSEKTTDYALSLFIIATQDAIKYLIYSFGKKIKDGKWKSW